MIINVKIITSSFIDDEKLTVRGEILSQINGKIPEKEIWIVAFGEIKEMLEKSIQLEKNDIAKISGEYKKKEKNQSSFYIKSLISFQRKSKTEKPQSQSQSQKQQKKTQTDDTATNCFFFFEDEIYYEQDNIPPPKRKYSDRHLKGKYYNFDEMNVSREDIIRMRKDDPLSMYNLGYEPIDDCLKPL